MKKDVTEIIEAAENNTNKELVLGAAIATAVGVVIGFFIGKATTSKNTVKKFNECYSYDFGDEEEKVEE